MRTTYWRFWVFAPEQPSSPPGKRAGPESDPVRASLNPGTTAGLRKQNAWLEGENNMAVSRMAADLSHEINNLLAIIKTTLLTLRYAIPEDHAEVQYIDQSEKEIDRIVRITRQLVSLFRPLHDTAHPCMLDEILRDTAALVTAGNRERSITIGIRTPATPVMSSFPEGLLRRILFNIVSNTAEAAQRDSQITIALAAHGNGASIKVSASTEGMGKEGEGFETKGKGPRQIRRGFLRQIETRMSVPKVLLKKMGGSLSFGGEADQNHLYTILIPFPPGIMEVQNG